MATAQTDAQVIDAISDAPIVMPNDPALLTAEYLRDGADLVIQKADGDVFIVEGYFEHPQPADLMVGGAVVPGRVVGKLARPAPEPDAEPTRASASEDDTGAPGQAQAAAEPGRLASEAAAPRGEPIAEIAELDGEVLIQRADGSLVSAEVGTPLYEDDVLSTAADGSVGVSFVDGMTFSLGADARMLLDEFAYDPAANAGGGLLSILQGEFSFVSGDAAHTAEDALMIETPTMTIGVRGTKVVSHIAAEGETSRIALLAEEDGTVGKIMVMTDAGEQLISEPNKMVEVTGRQAPPSAQMDVSSSDVLRFFGDALGTLPAPKEFFEPEEAEAHGTAPTTLRASDGGAGARAELQAAAEESAQRSLRQTDVSSRLDDDDDDASASASVSDASFAKAAPVSASSTADDDDEEEAILTAAERLNQEALATSDDDDTDDDDDDSAGSSASSTDANDAPVLDASGAPTLTAVSEDATAPVGNTVAEIVVDGSITDADGSAVEAIALTGVDDVNGTWEYSLDGGATFAAVGAVSDASALLLDATARLRFVPNADYFGSATVAYRAWDQSTGASGDSGVDVSSNGGATAFSSAAETASVTIASVNDAPVLDTSGAPTLTEVATNAADPTGDTVAEIVGDGSISDADGSAGEAIALTGVDDANGTWQVSLDGGASFSDVGAVSDNAALLLGESAVLRFVPDAGYTGSATITYRAWDQSTGASGDSGVDVSSNGGTTAYSTAAETASVTVAANSAPVISVAGALSLSGAYQYVDAGDPGATNDDLDPQTGDLTVEAWFYWDGYADSVEAIVSKGNDGDSKLGYSVTLEDDQLVVRANGEGNATDASTAASHVTMPSEAGWYHVAMVIEQEPGDGASSVTGYLNGSNAGWSAGYDSVVDDTFTAPDAGIDALDGFLIGAAEKNGNTSSYFDGKVSDVRVWSTARSGTEIETDMGRTLNGDEQDLVANWRLDDGVGGLASNSVAGGADASISGGAGWIDLGALTTALNTAVEGRLTATDDNGDALSFSVATDGAHGTATIDADTGAWTYTPDSGYVGLDTVSYQVSDGNGGVDTINVTVTVV